MPNNIPSPHSAALKIWLAGSVLGPIFGFLGKSMLTLSDPRDLYLDEFLLLVLFGGLLSTPSMGILWLVLTQQHRFRQTALGFWSLILGITLFLTAAPFLVLDLFLGEADSLSGLSGPIAAYLAGIWLGVYWVYGREKVEEPASSDDEPLDSDN